MKPLGKLTRVALVLLINFCLFLIIPVSQRFMSNIAPEKNEEEEVYRVVAEMVKPPEPPKQQQQQSRIRSVNASSGRSMQDQMQFDLSPDLSGGGGGDGVAMQSGQMEAEVFDEGSVDQPAVARQIPPFRYPDEARELGITGSGLITFIVGTEGRVVEVIDMDVPHPSIDRAVRSWLPSLTFTPAQNQGVPVAQKMQLPMEFKLN